MISTSNHLFTTPNKPFSANFPLFNEGQLIEHRFQIAFNYNFNSTAQNQFMITAQNQLTMLNGSFADFGVLTGDSIYIAAVRDGVNINFTATIGNVNGSVLTLTTNAFSSDVVNEFFPLGGNEQMFIVNNTRDLPEAIDVFYNLTQNNAAPTNNSIWDGEVNRFTSALPTIDGIYPLTQIGNKSGGTFISSLIEVIGGDYFCVFKFIPWLSYEQNNLSLPSWYAGSSCIKPVVSIVGFSQIGDPNNTISGGQSAWLGNTGWYNEDYNQGTDNFILSDLVASNELSANNINSISFKVSNVLSAVSTSVQISLTSVFPESESKNNNFSRFENQIGTLYVDANNIILSTKNGAECELTDVVVTPSGNDILVGFDVTPNSNFTQYVQAQNEDVYYRLVINVNGLAQVNNVTKIIKEGVWEITPTPPIIITNEKSGFLDHSQLLTGGYSTDYDGCTEDDMLFSGEVVLQKNTIYNNVRLSIDVIKDSDSALVANLQQIIFNLANVPILNGVYQVNFNTLFNQFLDSEGRNAATLTLGSETSTTYEVNYIYSLMANWRDWVSLTNTLPDFYDFNLIQNGQSAEWVNYLRLSGYSIKLRLELNGQNQEYLTRNIDLLDYDESDNVTTEIVILDSDGNVVPSVLNNQIYTIRAIHTTTDVWSERLWGWIGMRPNESEPMKRISTAYDWSAQNLPLQPLLNETRALLTIISPTVVHVECQINSNEITNLSTIIARIHDYE